MISLQKPVTVILGRDMLYNQGRGRGAAPFAFSFCPALARRAPLRYSHLLRVWIPFGIPALARECLPFSDFSTLAIQGHPFSAKRNGGGCVFNAGSDDKLTYSQGQGLTMLGKRAHTNCRTTHHHSVWPPNPDEKVMPLR